MSCPKCCPTIRRTNARQAWPTRCGAETRSFLAPALIIARGSDSGVVCIALFFVLSGVFSFVEAASQSGIDSGPMPRGALATGVLLLSVFVVAVGSGGTWPAPWAGAIVMLLGIALRGAAMRSLGESFVSDVRAAPRDQLVAHGLYAVLRHPSEAGLLCIAGGAAWLLGSTPAIAVFALVLVPTVVIRVRHEDRKLRALFGPAHAAYSRRVPALIPLRIRRADSTPR